MEIVSLFSTPVAADDLLLDNIALEKFCKQKVKEDEVDAPIVEKSQSKFLNLSTPELQPLLIEVYNRFNMLYKQMDLQPNTKLDIFRAWININNTNAIDTPHVHPDSVFSGVYYVKGSGVEENGSLVLHSPVSALQHCINPKLIVKNNYFNCFAHTIVPITGRLVLFPSWIMHNVQKNYLPEERISIAFDAIIVNK
jgi:uncharacterized protein (TIGR02466 family)